MLSSSSVVVPDENSRCLVTKTPYDRVSQRTLAHEPTRREANEDNADLDVEISTRGRSLADIAATGSCGGLMSVARVIALQTLLHAVDWKKENNKRWSEIVILQRPVPLLCSTVRRHGHLHPGGYGPNLL